MLPEDEYFSSLTEEQLWQRYCGFLDLPVDEFLEIQRELLMDEMERVADSLLAKKIMGNHRPRNVEEFRTMVPLTIYEDYEPYLSQKQEDALAQKPYLWCHSAGRSGYFKWIPHSREGMEKTIKSCLGGIILASTREKGRINISPGIRGLVLLAPPPYASGCLFHTFAQYFSFQFIPDPKKTENLEFQERMEIGFQTALKSGVDVIGAISSVMVRIGEEFSGRTRGMRLSLSMLHPKIVLRVLRAWLRSNSEKRPILPKDVWPTKAILAGGVDTAIYKKDIAYYWGKEPYEFYVSAETFLLAIQSWTKKGMVFIPDIAFYEFIPYDDGSEYEDDKKSQPSTVLLNELEEGKLYEVVITQFYGMPLLRYRMKDLVKVVALRDEEAGIALPHIVFQRRVDEIIHLAGLARLDEKTIWQAIANTGIKYADWTARKEYDENRSILRLYLELKEQREAAEVENTIDEQLLVVDTDYRDIHSYLGLQPLRVTLLSPGTFQRYMEEKSKEGVDLAHLKPAHINPPETVIQRLLQLS